MGNDEGNDRDDADMAGTGQQRGSSTDESVFKGALEEEPRPSDGEEAHDQEVIRSPRSQELIHAADLLVEASESELVDAGLEKIVAASYSRQWSGMLPIPEEYNKYDPDTRERICRWNDSFTTDESARQDRLVDNEIKQQDRGVILTFVLMAGFGVATLVAFLVTRDAASFALLSVPLLNVLGSLFKPAMSKSSRQSVKGSQLDE